MSNEGLPPLLTVEEAGSLLRIGRTKAYAMAREWRETEGRSGLPVIDLGHVLRVPRQALEELLGSDLTDAPRRHPTDDARKTVASGKRPQSQTCVSTEIPPAQEARTSFRNRRRHKIMANQLDLFDAEPAAS